MPQPAFTAQGLAALSIVWVESGADPYLASHLHELSEAGLTIEVSPVELTAEVVADVRVLPEWAFDRIERIQVEYPLDPRPTLLLGKSPGSVDALLRMARNSDDVGHGGEAPATLVRRLIRLAGRAESYRRPIEARDRDALTGLWNRQRMAEEIERLLEDSVSSDDAIGLLFLDLDWFKKTNDMFGHHAGDTVLRRAAAAVRLHRCR